jgi:hypothetical protein
MSERPTATRPTLGSNLDAIDKMISMSASEARAYMERIKAFREADPVCQPANPIKDGSVTTEMLSNSLRELAAVRRRREP